MGNTMSLSYYSVSRILPANGYGFNIVDHVSIILH
jgi:hypothetical protein